MGVAASIASVILMAADKITMPENAFVMVHAPSGGVFGNASDMREMADVLDKISASLVATYVKRTGKTEDEVKAMLATDTWMTAAEAKAAGFADEVLDAVELTAKWDMADDRIPEAQRAAFKAVAKPAPVVAVVPPAKPAVPVAEQIAALAKEAGFEAHGGGLGAGLHEDRRRAGAHRRGPRDHRAVRRRRESGQGLGVHRRRQVAGRRAHRADERDGRCRQARRHHEAEREQQPADQSRPVGGDHRWNLGQPQQANWSLT
jgi:hypothetical protein